MIQLKSDKVTMQSMKNDQDRTITLLIWHTVSCLLIYEYTWQVLIPLQDGEDPLAVQKVVATYPRVQLRQFDDLMQAFTLTAGSPVQRWDLMEHGWIMGDPQSVMTVGTVPRLLIRLPASLLQPWKKCPGLEDEIHRLGHRNSKRRAPSPLPSPPPSKVAHVGEAVDATLCSVMGSTGAHPEVQATDAASVAIVTVQATVAAAQDSEVRPVEPVGSRQWPRDYNVSEIAAGFEQMANLIAGTSIDLRLGSFLKVHANCTYRNGAQ